MTEHNLALAHDSSTERAGTRDALEMHFRAMSAFRLLTREDELSLARRLEAADFEITRILLESPEGCELLRERARMLRAGETRPEDIERNPGEELATRLERALVRARRSASTGARSPRASRARARRSGSASASSSQNGLRLHPRAVHAMVRELEELLRLKPNTRLRRTLVELSEPREEVDEVTAELVQSNLRIVVTFARRYRGMPLVDLLQEGNLGLLRAIDKFDHRRGLRFSTYAAWWIRHSLGRALADQSKMIRLPVHLTGTVQRVRRAKDRFERETGREPSPEELVARTGIALEQIRRALDVVAQPISLDTPVGGTADREAGELADLVVDSAVPGADEAVAERELHADTTSLLAELPAREAEIIRLRFGLGGGAQQTLEEIGSHLRLSRERARQLERDALRKLRVVSESRRLRAHLGY